MSEAAQAGDGAILRRRAEGAANGAFGLSRQFLITADDSGGALSQWIEEVPAGAGPPLHVHEREREYFRVLEGAFRFWSGEESFEAGDGDTVLVPAGTPHSFRNIGAEKGQLLITMTPGGLENFFIEVESKGLQPEGDMPEIAAIAARYNLKFVGPPPA